MKHGAFPAWNVLRLSIALVALLALAGCVDPGPGAPAPDEPEPEGPTATPAGASAKPRTLPVLLLPDPEEPQAAPTPAATPVADPTQEPTPEPTAPTPVSPTPPPPREGPAFNGAWEHDHELPERVVTVQVAPGFGATDLVVGFRPDHAQGRSRCAAPNATISVTAPSGERVVDRAYDAAPATGGCGARTLVPNVGFEPGAWEIAFRGTGDAIGYVAAGERAVVAEELRVEMQHDFTRPERTTYFSVAPLTNASDLTIAVGARSPGEACPADSVRIIVRDPSERVVTRIEVPSEPLPSDCARASVVRDTILAPGRWSVQWGGSGHMVGALRVEPAAP